MEIEHLALRLPMDSIPAKEDYSIYSAMFGLVSAHKSATDAVKAFAAHARANPETDAAIFKRHRDGWKVF